MSGTRARKHIDRIGEVKMELMTLGALLCTIRHGAINRLATEELARIGGNNGGLILDFQFIN